MCLTYEICIDSSSPGRPWISHGSAGEDHQHFKVCGMKSILNLTVILVWFALITLFYLAIAEREKGGQPSKEKEKKPNNTFEVNNFAAVEINEAAGKKNLKALKVRVCGCNE